jgi:adenine-specific DNA-methyltransferase
MSIVAEPFLQNSLRARSSRQFRMAAERLLWTYLRSGRFAHHRFRRQHLIEPYLADFACPAAKLIVEIVSDFTPALALHALRRRTFLESRGYRVLRFSDRETLVDPRAVLATIRAALPPT